MSRERQAKRLIAEKFRLIGVFAASAGDTITESEAVISIRGMLTDIETMQKVVSGEYPAVQLKPNETCPVCEWASEDCSCGKKSQAI